MWLYIIATSHLHMIGTHYTGHFVTNILFMLHDIKENRIILSFAFTYLHVDFF